jgi:hypothetical protein
MNWTFERTFYGDKQGLNLRSIRDFLMRGYYPIPCTLFNGYYRAVRRVGDHDRLYSCVRKPFPDVLLAQKPDERFALHLSGGFDSSILAKLYDRDDADYIHLTGPESHKARALGAILSTQAVVCEWCLVSFLSWTKLHLGQVEGMGKLVELKVVLRTE